MIQNTNLYFDSILCLSCPFLWVINLSDSINIPKFRINQKTLTKIGIDPMNKL